MKRKVKDLAIGLVVDVVGDGSFAAILDLRPQDPFIWISMSDGYSGLMGPDEEVDIFIVVDDDTRTITITKAQRAIVMRAVDSFHGQRAGIVAAARAHEVAVKDDDLARWEQEAQLLSEVLEML